MESLDNRLNREINLLEKKYNLKLSETQKEQVKDGITVGYSRSNTFDFALSEIETRVAKIAYRSPSVATGCR